MAGKSVRPGLLGGSASIVNGTCFVVGGLLAWLPSLFLPDDPTLSDYRSALWILPVFILAGVVAGLALHDTSPAEVEQLQAS